jgi:DNA-binding Xre family transcriptional regulator
MLTYNFTRIFKARGIDKPFSFLVKKGYSNNFATRIVNNRFEKLNLKDIELLCEMLHCTPNDFLEWIPSPQNATIPNHPLTPLKRTGKVVRLSQMLNSVPLDRLSDIENLILKEIEK